MTADDRGVAAPRPGGRISTRTGANRVQRKVADEFERMSVRFDQHRVVAPLEAMTRLAVTPVEMLRVAGIQSLHASREIGIWRPHEQVVVRRHQNERVARPFVSGDNVVQQLQELTSILVVAKDRLTSYASRGDVVRGAGRLETRWTRHAAKVVRKWQHETARAAFGTML